MVDLQKLQQVVVVVGLLVICCSSSVRILFKINFSSRNSAKQSKNPKFNRVSVTENLKFNGPVMERVDFPSLEESLEGKRKNFVVVVVGDSHTQNFPEGFSIFGYPITAMDTSLRNKHDMEEKLKGANCIVLTYACDQARSFDRLTKFENHYFID